MFGLQCVSPAHVPLNPDSTPSSQIIRLPGLASYFYTRDLARAWRVAEELEYGMVGDGTPGSLFSLTQ